MRLIKPSFKIEGVYMEDPLAMESIGRVCYKSEDKITEGSAEKFIKARLGQHESVIEHSALTVRFVCDRGVSHELVRHRLASFSQESTRYCNYKDEVTFIIPPWCSDIKEGTYKECCSVKDMYTQYIQSSVWMEAMVNAEKLYMDLIKYKWTPQQARTVLPNSTKTEIVMTANFREWRHIFRLRCDKTAHPQMQELMRPLLAECQKTIPIIFDDITY